jgi:hypothetical protein
VVVQLKMQFGKLELFLFHFEPSLSKLKRLSIQFWTASKLVSNQSLGHISSMFLSH